MLHLLYLTKEYNRSVISVKLSKDNINQREIYRYLGYRGITPDDQITSMIDEVLTDLLAVIHPRSLYKTYQCQIIEANSKQIALSELESDFPKKIPFYSNQLAANLRGCPYVILMAATLGIEADKLLHKYELINMAKASVLQACAAAAIEACCNMLQQELQSDAARHGFYLRPRFSPGYGDLPLAAQKDFFQAIDCTKRLGITLTDSLLMYPTKSVTAFIGVTPQKEDCHIGKCKQCKNIGCEFRDEDT